MRPNNTNKEKAFELYRLVEKHIVPIILCTIAIENWNDPDIEELRKELYQESYHDILGMTVELISDDFIDVSVLKTNHQTGMSKKMSKTTIKSDYYCEKFKRFIMLIIKDFIKVNIPNKSIEDVLLSNDLSFNKLKDIYDNARQNRLSRKVDPYLLCKIRELEELI